MYATRSKTNRPVIATHWNGSSWSNGKPNSVKDAYIDANYSTASGNFSCRDLIITSSSLLTIITDSYVKVLRNINQSPTSQIIVKNQGNLMILHKNAVTDTVKVQAEATFKDHQRLDYEFISSPISGIPIKNISPGTLDNRFYTYDENLNEYISVPPNTTLSTQGLGYMIRVPSNFPTTPSNWNISINNNIGGLINKGKILTTITKNQAGVNIIGNPFLAKINLKKLFIYNKNMIQLPLYFWNKSNGAQGGNYTLTNLCTDNLNIDRENIKQFRAFLVIKRYNSPPNEVVFTPDMMIPSADFTTPDRLYIIIRQQNINFPIGGFCYDIKKFPSLFQDVAYTGSLTIIDNGNKVICRKESFNTTDVINIRLFFEVAATYTISIKSNLGLFESLPNIYLLDELTGSTHDLKTSGYTFSSEAGEHITRFKIKFQL